MTSDELDSLIEAGKIGLLEEKLFVLSKEERRALAEPARKQLRKLNALRGQREWERLGSQITHGRHAVLACCPFGDVKKLPWSEMLMMQWVGSTRQPPVVVDFLRRLSPEWLPGWGQWIFEQRSESWAWTTRWQTVFEFVESGLCSKPENDVFAMEMVAALRFSLSGQPLDKTSTDIFDFLKSRLPLLEADIWRLFAVEAVAEMNLTNLDSPGKGPSPVGPFANALIQLQSGQLLSRERLIESTFNAIASDFKPYCNRWFLRFYEALDLTPGEKESFAERHVQALGSSFPETQKWALREVAALRKSGSIRIEAIVGYLEALTATSNKGVAMAAFRLLEEGAKSAPDQRRDILLSACKALGSGLVEVQERALQLIDRYGDPQEEALSSLLMDYGPSVAVSLRERFPKWLNVSPVETTAAQEEPDAVATSVLAPEQAIVPIATIRELIDAAAYMVENPTDIEEFERVLDGLSRLGSARPPDFAALTQPLGARIEKLSSQYPDAATCLVLGSLGDWISLKRRDLRRQVPAEQMPLQDFIVQRVKSVNERIDSGKSAPLLSAPTHRGFWVDPVVFVSRFLSLEEPPDSVDLIQALLRLAPERRGEALEAAAKPEGETGDAIRYALGGTLPEIGPNASLWVAACRARNPLENAPEVEAVHGNRFPDTSHAACYDYAVRVDKYRNVTIVAQSTALKAERPPAVSFPTAALHWRRAHELSGYGSSVGVIRWLQGIWPQNQEPYAAKCASSFSELLTSKSLFTAAEVQAACAPFFHVSAPLGAMSSLLIALLLPASDPACRALAVDLLIQTVSDGRFSRSTIAGTLGDLTRHKLFSLPRIAAPLADLARVSAMHAAAAKSLVEVVIAHFQDPNPAPLVTLCELLGELCAQLRQPVENPAVLDILRSINPSGETGKAAQRLLAGAGESPGPVRKKLVIERLDLFRKAVPQVPGQVPLLDKSRALSPIATFGQLEEAVIELLRWNTALERIDRFSLIWDAISRLCDQSPALSQKSLAKLRQTGFHDKVLLRRLTFVLFHTWIDGWDFSPGLTPQEPLETPFVVELLRGIATRVKAGTSMPLLSTPTHRGGWIRPLTLVERVRVWNERKCPIDPYDLSLALFRLSFEEREPAIEAAAGLEGEAGAAIQYALGIGEPVRSECPNLPVAAAMARRRSPIAFPDSWVIQVGKGGEEIVMKPVPCAPGSDLLTHLRSLPEPASYYRTEVAGPEVWSWSLTAIPSDPEPIMARAAIALFREDPMGWEAFIGDYYALFETAHPPFGSSSALLLWGGVLRSVAWNRVPARIDRLVLSGNLSPSIAGAVLSQLIPTRFFKALSVSRRLLQVAELSPVHAGWVLETLVAVLRGDVSMAPRDIRHLLLLTLQLALSRGTAVQDPTARTYLEGIPIQGQTREIARALLELRDLSADVVIHPPMSPMNTDT